LVEANVSVLPDQREDIPRSATKIWGLTFGIANVRLCLTKEKIYLDRQPRFGVKPVAEMSLPA
jgi:hypothetical protein